jgi:transposase-like protein
MPKKAPEWLNPDIQEFYPTCQGNIRAIQRAILDKRGVEIAYMTITDRMKQLGLERPRDKKKAPKETPMSIDAAPVEVLPGQMRIEDADTASSEVHYDAVNEFDALPAGYAKVIQPMQIYSEAEEWALNKSMELYGFIGAIVRDQYGRILDGHHRQGVARRRGLGVPYTITFVRDDAHATDIARALNTVRRHYTKEQREELAPMMRDQGFTYEAIAEALGVGKATVYRDVMGVLQVRTESEIVPNETIHRDNHEPIVPNETIKHENHGEIVPNETISAASREPSPPVQRVKRKGGGTYPAQRPTGTAQRPSTSPAERQVAQVINILMTHAPQWDDKHWQTLLEVVQTLRGNREAPATT